MQRYGTRRGLLGGGILALVVATMVAAVPGAPMEEADEVMAPSGSTDLAAPVEVGEPTGISAAPRPESPAAVAEDDVSPVLETQTGSASYYADMLAGRRTASGVRYDPSAAVAAHRQLPFGTRLRVHNLSNGRTVEVEVVDRGPFAKGRILDLSRSAARELGFIRQGHTRVRIEVLEYGG